MDFYLVYLMIIVEWGIFRELSCCKKSFLYKRGSSAVNKTD